MIRRLLCALGLHAPRFGVDTRTSIRWDCRCCGQVTPGPWAAKRRRR